MTASTSLHSNAFNFLSYVSTGVDPRTGQYTCTISLPPLKANNLCGPDVPLSLRFSPLNRTDSGFGLGWDLQLSQYNPDNQILSLSSGETFKVTGSGPQPDIREKKLDSFHFFDNRDGTYRVVHKSGLEEILSEGGADKIALPSQMRSAQGHVVTLHYDNEGQGRRLAGINNADGTPLLRLEPAQARDKVFLRLHPGTLYEALFTMQMSNDRWVTRIELPTEEKASWRFDYDLQPAGGLRLKRVETPVGGVETITYAQIPHYIPNVDRDTLARVDTHHNDPGFGQPAIVTHYTYPADHHNFLGYDSGAVWSDDGLDNLYRAKEDYIYSTTQSLWDVNSNTAIRRITRTFNRFHLLRVEETTQNDNVLHNETFYHLQPGTEFEHQPAYCQLPHIASQTWYRKSNPDPKHTETVTTTYDDFGNLLTQVNANGVTETSTWYMAEGEKDEEGNVLCPKDPHDFVRHLKSKTVTPAPSKYGAAPVLQTQYRYAGYQGLEGRGTWLAIRDETLLQVGNDQEPLQVTAYTYIDQPDNPFEHGRKLRDEVTLNGKTTTTSYQYSKTAHVRNGEPVQHTVSTLTGFDGVMKSITSEHSLFTGEALLNQDDNDVKIAHEYDLLGRMTTEIVAPGTAYEASRTYTYKLTNKMGQQAEQYFTDVKDVCTRTLLDGLNRVVHEELIGSDPSDPERVIRTYSARYNARGQLSQDTVYDWWERDGLLEERALTTRYRYDDWGQEHRVTEPSGVVSVTQNDPITLEQLTWLESSDIEPRISNTTLTTTNLFEKPLKVQQLDGQQKPVSEREFFYDGLGNCVKQYDEMGEPTLFEYDPWSRLSSTTLPDGTRINRQYAEHSSASLPVSLKVNPNGNVEASPLLAGEQAFDGLDRLKYLSVGPRTLRYEYQGGSLQACKHITAKGQEIAYEYQSGLTDQPVGIMAADEHASFTYDPHSAQLLRTENDQGVYVFDHDKTGRLLGECWIEAGTTLQQTRYTSSPRGLPVSRTETDGLVTTYAYDLHGRVECVRQGQLQTTFSYDSLGQLQSTRNEDLSAGSVLLTGWEYDEQGREIQRTLSLNGQATRTLLQTYRPDNKLATRHLLEDSRSLLLETFTYDARGRLERYQCAGESLPRDRYGNAIVEQYFAFDALDNITHAWSTFEDGSSDEAVSGYATTDPCQLVNVTHTHADYLKEFPQGIHLHYDADGHLETDERGHYLRYDTQGRLLSVNEMTGSVISRYRYDGHNQLRGVKHRTGSETLRFYQDDRLSSTRQGDTCINYFYGDDQPVGQQTIGDDTQTLLFLTDAKHSLLGESQGDTLRAAVYGAYGERHSDVPMQSTLGFNGEIREDQHGWYLLGKGYRAYNPHLRRFHSPDSFSPFGSGGVNPYLYCVSDPINHIDPTGHAALQQYAYEAMGSKVDWGMIVQIGLMVALTAVSLYFAPGAAAALIGKASALTKLGAAANLLSTGAEATSTVTGVAAVVTNSSSLRKASVISGNAGMVGLVTPVTSVGRAFGKSIGKNSASSVRPRLSSNKYKPPADLSPDGAADPFRVSTIKARPPTPPPQPESNSPKPVRLSGEPQASVSHLSHTTDFSKLPSGDPPPVLKKTYPEEAAWHPLDGGWLRGSKVKEIQAEILTAHKQNRTPIIKHLYL